MAIRQICVRIRILSRYYITTYDVHVRDIEQKIRYDKKKITKTLHKLFSNYILDVYRFKESPENK